MIKLAQNLVMEKKFDASLYIFNFIIIIKKIFKRCRYTAPETKPTEKDLDISEMCNCSTNSKDRCGPSSNCLNRLLHIECPPVKIN